MKNPQSSVRYSVIAPGTRSPPSPPSAIHAPAAYRLEVRARGLERRFELAEQAFRLLGVVGRVVAHVDVDRDRALLRPRMNREMRLGEDHRSGDALRLELVKTIADDCKTGLLDGCKTALLQRHRVRHFRRIGRAVVPLSKQMNSIHHSSPTLKPPTPVFLRREKGNPTKE